MQHVGAISGAALGYITRGRRGAVAGYKFGHSAGKSFQKKSMVNGTPKRKRSTSSLFSTPRVRRRLSFSSTKSGGSSRSSRKSVRFRVSSKITRSRLARVPTNARNVAVGKRKRGMKKVGKKKVKVSRKLRAQVKQVISGTKPVGFFREGHEGLIELRESSQELGYGIHQVGATTLPFTEFKQWVYSRTTNNRWNFTNFTLGEILDAASVLFFNKIAKLEGQVVGTHIQNYESRPIEQPVIYKHTVSHGLMDTKFRVVNSSVTYEFNNNTHLAYKVKMYKCSPKKLKAYKGTQHPALQDWYDAMLYENQGMELTISDTPAQTVYPGGVTRIGIAGQNNGVGAVGFSTNTNGHTIHQLGMSPTQSPMWNSEWKSGLLTFTLEPGQKFTHVVKGPKNVEFDAKKWILNKQPALESAHESYVSNFAFMKPHWSEEIILVMTPEVRPNARGTATMVGEIDTDVNHKTGVSVHCVKAYSIEMPETTGTIFTAATEGVLPPTIVNKELAMNNRKRSYYYNDWKYTSAGPLVSEMAIVRPEDPDNEMQEDELPPPG